MTAQIPDTLLLEERTFSIAGVNGQGLFDPASYGMYPLQRITSCWRGYVCEYKLLSNKLFLNRLRINLGTYEGDGNKYAFAPEAGPQINGVEPVLATVSQDFFSNTYHQLNLHVEFTGGILAADDFIQELYVHMGFHPAWKYRHVVEVILSHGYVTETRDVSGIMQEIRNKMVKS